MKVSCQHIATNANPTPNSIQFINEQLVAFTFYNQVGIYSLTTNGIFINMNDPSIHANRANCVVVIRPQPIMIAVGYDTGNVIIYSTNLHEYKIQQTIKQQSSIISIHNTQHSIITNNNLGIIHEYQLVNGSYTPLTSLKFPLNKIIQSMDSISVDGSVLLLLGGVDQKIHGYHRKIQQSQYTYGFTLDGHENAITKICVVRESKDEYALASASKDGYVRIWKITTNSNLTKFHKNVKEIQMGTIMFKVFLESVLVGHQCSVTGLSWSKFRKIELISCSLDCVMCVWGREEQAWQVENKMGQFLGNKTAYFNVISNSQHIIAVNYIGSALIWQYQDDQFQLRESFTGHSSQVNDIDWDHTGNFLVSVSKDQTTRILSRNNNKGYSEISRAQIHGYDINSVATIQVSKDTIDLIACGADEKVIRILQPPACFANYLNTYTQANLHLFFNSHDEEKKYLKSKEGQTLLYETYAEGGVQVLGLMTKMQRVQRQNITNYYDEEQQQINQADQQLDTQPITNVDYRRPPHDDYLIKHTLWPEMNKLYGHPHEIECLAHSADGKYMVSSCNALNKQSASMIVWDTSNWKIVCCIQHHSYTVYDMCYSNNMQYLASVSKDRKLSIFLPQHNYKLLWSIESSTRAITSVSINNSSELVIIGSRDRLIKCYHIESEKLVSELNMKYAVYCISWGVDDLIACGCGNGSIYLLKLDQQMKILDLLYEIPSSIGHSGIVNRIRWKSNTEYEFGSCSDDHSVRIFKVIKP